MEALTYLERCKRSQRVEEILKDHQYFSNYELLKHQIETVVDSCTWYEERGDMLPNFSEPGTGKTLSTLSIIGYLHTTKNYNKILIVCPNSLKNNWAKEIEKFYCYVIKTVIVTGSLREKQKLLEGLKPNNICIINYDYLLKAEPYLNKWGADIVVLDEAHLIKGHTALRSKVARRLHRKVSIALTGTPTSNNPLDCWAIYDFVKPGYFDYKFYKFQERYAVYDYRAGYPKLLAYKNIPELKEKMNEFMIRWEKKQCLDLPEKTYQVIKFDLEDKERKIYDQLSDDLVAELEGETILATHILTRFMKCEQVTSGFIIGENKTPKEIGSSKLCTLMDLLDSLSGQKVIVFTKFRHENESIVKGVKGRAALSLTGGMTDAERNQIIERFQNDPGNHVLVANISVGGVGLNLTAASYVIYYSNSWSLVDRTQTEDRTHRIGQVNKVTYYDLIANNTINEYIYKVVKRKVQMAEYMTSTEIKAALHGK